MPLHTSALPREVTKLLIVRKDALPVPPEMEKVIDCVCLWGSTVDRWWYHQVMKHLHHMLKTGIWIPEHILFWNCINYRVRNMLRFNWAPAADIQKTHDDWCIWFDMTCTLIEGDYFYLAVTSFQWIRARIHVLSINVSYNQSL